MNLKCFFGLFVRMIVFAMFALGAASILTKEIVSIKNQFKQSSGPAKK